MNHEPTRNDQMDVLPPKVDIDLTEPLVLSTEDRLTFLELRLAFYEDLLSAQVNRLYRVVNGVRREA